MFSNILTSSLVKFSKFSHSSLSTHRIDLSKKFNEPISPNDLHRAGGIATFMRLPFVEHPEKNPNFDLDVSIIGVPFDTATSNRPGARFGPRHIRAESPMIRKRSHGTGAEPFQTLMVGDIGDVDICMYDIQKAADRITDYFKGVLNKGSFPLAIGGDHLITYPILRAIGSRFGPVALIHVDAHSDTAEHQSGFPLTHGTPFRRAWEDKLLDSEKIFQIGLRGTGLAKGDIGWGREQGWTVIQVEELWHKSAVPLMEKIRRKIGPETPVYLSFDIDAIDPSACPGTGTPEIAGLTVIQAVEIIRGCRGLNIVGADVVEVSPIYDVGGSTALTAANLLFEMLCIVPGAKIFH